MAARRTEAAGSAIGRPIRYVAAIFRPAVKQGYSQGLRLIRSNQCGPCLRPARGVSQGQKISCGIPVRRVGGGGLPAVREEKRNLVTAAYPRWLFMIRNKEVMPA